MSYPNLCPACDHPLPATGGFCPGCGAPNQPSAGGPSVEAPQSRWDSMLERVRAAVAPRYRVLRVLGFGGMAGVYLAEETKLARRVAIKVMAPEMMVDPSLVDRFQHEAQTIARLRHPNIVSIYNIDDIEGLPYFVMDYIPGRTLGDVITGARGSISIPVIFHWLYQVGTALDYAHRAGIVHRDVKPGNVLLDAEGNALVSDFGIAKAADRPGLTQTGMLVGTPAYVSPEYCLSGVAGSASDQYSFGIVAYEVLTGRPPFTGPTVTTLQAHISEPPPPLASLRPDCPPELRAAVERMLAKRPEDRFPDISAALSAMGAATLPRESPLFAELISLVAPVEGVSLERLPQAVCVGDSFIVPLRVWGENGSELHGRKVEWSSANPEVVSADEEGILHARGPGEARISARCEGMVASQVIQIHPAAAGRLDLTPIPLSLPTGASLPLQDQMRGASTAAPIAWGTSNPRIAAVTPDGRIEARSPGTVVLFASAGSQTASTVVRVHPGVSPVVTSPHSWESRSVAGPTIPAPGTDAARSTQVPVAGAAQGQASPAPGRFGKRAVVMAVAAVIVVAGGVIAARTTLGNRGASTAEEAGSTSSEPIAAPRETAAPVATALDQPAVVEETTVSRAARPEVGGSSAPAATSPGEIRVLGQLPPGGTITVTGSDRQTRRMNGRSLAVPPGSYTVAVMADGFEPAEGVIQVTPGAVATWSPTLVAEPAPVASAPVPVSEARSAAVNPEPAPPPASASPSGDVEAIRSVVGGFVRSLESRDVGQIQRLYPYAAEGWLTQWRAFLSNREDVRELRTTISDIGSPEISGSTGRIRFALLLSWNDLRNVRQQQRLNMNATLRREGGDWVIQSLQGGR